jgi:hypothetical protein
VARESLVGKSNHRHPVLDLLAQPEQLGPARWRVLGRAQITSGRNRRWNVVERDQRVALDP